MECPLDVLSFTQQSWVAASRITACGFTTGGGVGLAVTCGLGWTMGRTRDVAVAFGFDPGAESRW